MNRAPIEFSLIAFLKTIVIGIPKGRQRRKRERDHNNLCVINREGDLDIERLHQQYRVLYRRTRSEYTHFFKITLNPQKNVSYRTKPNNNVRRTHLSAVVAAYSAYAYAPKAHMCMRMQTHTYMHVCNHHCLSGVMVFFQSNPQKKTKFMRNKSSHAKKQSQRIFLAEHSGSCKVQTPLWTQAPKIKLT